MACRRGNHGEIKIIAVIGKLRPKARRGRTVSLDDLADEIAGQSGFDRGDARGFAYEFARGLVNHLKYGDYVKLGEIGDFYLSYDKNKRVRVTHRASGELNRELAQDSRGGFIKAEDDEGYAQRWLELHPEDTVIMRDGSARTASA